MGLLSGFVLVADRRGLLAILAIAVSVGYALIAGAATAGLQDAQQVLGQGLTQQSGLAARDDLGPFSPNALPLVADASLAVHDNGTQTYYTVRTGPQIAAGTAIAGNATVHRAPGTLTLTGQRVTHSHPQAPRGARPDGIGVDTATFERLGGAPPPTIHVALYENMDQDLRGQLDRAGFHIVQAPSVVPFYTQGAHDLVTGVAVTILASTLVVALIANSFVSMEIQSRRASFATLQLYAGAGRVQGLVFGRGAVLVTAGHLVAILATLLIIAVLRQGAAATFSLDPGWVGLALTATFLGGLIGIVPPLITTTRRLEARSLAARAPAKRPRWLRPILTSWKNLVPLTVAAIVLAASLGVILGGVAIPNQLFGTGDTDVLAAPSGNPLRGRLSAFMGTNLHQLEDFDAASPEVFAPTMLGTRPVMLRGVDWQRFTELEDVRIEAGSAPVAQGDVAVGARLARLAGLDVGDRLLLPASYTHSIHPVHVVGIVEAGGILDDELFTDLATARAIADTSPQFVNLVRVRAAPSIDGETVRPQIPNEIRATRPVLVPEEPVPNENVQLTVHVLNFADDTSQRQFTVHVNGRPVADAWVRLGRQGQAEQSFFFRAPPEGIQRLTVNPTLEPAPTPPAYRIEANARVLSTQNLNVRVLDYQDQPVSGVQVRLDGSQSRTGTDGSATLTPSTQGNRTLIAEGPAGRAARPVLVLDPANSDRSVLVVRSLNGPPEALAGAWGGVALVENIGGVTFEGRLPLDVDGLPQNATALRLGPGVLLRVPFSVDLALGNHTIKSQTQTVRTTIVAQLRADQGQDLSIEQLLQKRALLAQNEIQNRADATTSFLGETYANLNAALVVVVLATVLHAGLIVMVAVQRETEQRLETVSTLAAIGADPPTIRRLAIRDYALLSLLAGLLGTFLGLAATTLAAQLGIIQGFGHAILPQADLEFLLRLVAVSVATCFAASSIAIASVRSRTQSIVIAQGPRRTERPSLDVLLRGRP